MWDLWPRFHYNLQLIPYFEELTAACPHIGSCSTFSLHSLNIITHLKTRIRDKPFCWKHFLVLCMIIQAASRVWNKIWCSLAVSWQQNLVFSCCIMTTKSGVLLLYHDNKIWCSLAVSWQQNLVFSCCIMTTKSGVLLLYHDNKEDHNWSALLAATDKQIVNVFSLISSGHDTMQQKLFSA